MEHDNLTRQGSSSSACLEDEVDFATDDDAAAWLAASASAAAADAAICAVVESLFSEAGQNRDAEREERRGREEERGTCSCLRVAVAVSKWAGW